MIHPLRLGHDSKYNIFFQFERAFLLQVNLEAEADLNIDDAVKIFHPNQPIYEGLLLLPRQYAMMILPYNWILTAWKADDYCAQVCAARKITFRLMVLAEEIVVRQS